MLTVKTDFEKALQVMLTVEITHWKTFIGSTSSSNLPSFFKNQMPLYIILLTLLHIVVTLNNNPSFLKKEQLLPFSSPAC